MHFIKVRKTKKLISINIVLQLDQAVLNKLRCDLLKCPTIISNVEVLRRKGKEKKIVFAIKRRQLEYLSYNYTV